MTVATVWVLLVFVLDGKAPPSAIDGFPTLEHCRAMGRLVQKEQPGIWPVKVRCVQRQVVVAGK